ncbi:MAG: YgcG family protein [Hyphomicrobium sp.]
MSIVAERALTSRILAALAAFALILLALSSAHAAPTFPALTGQIVDDAHLLSPEDRAAILADLQALEGKSTDQLAIVTVPSLAGTEIEDYGYQLGRQWGIGQTGKDNGVLLIVAPNERKVRIEVGRGLEPIVTDLMSRIIIENAILPEFRRGNFGAGIRAGVRDLKDTLLGDAEAVKERARGLSEGDGPDWMGLLMIAFWIAIIVFILYAQSQYAAQQQQSMGGDQRRRARRRRDNDAGPIIFPGGGSDSWGGGWSGGSGGGGWSGGGGGFGGGGASGSW